MNYTALALFDDNENNGDTKRCLVAVGDKQGRLVLFDASKSSKLLEVSQRTSDVSKDFKHIKGGHESRINCIRFDSVQMNNSKEKSLHILTCSNRKKLCRWDLNGTLLCSQSFEGGCPYSFLTTFPLYKSKSERRWVIVGSRDIDIWSLHNPKQKDTVSTKPIAVFQGHASQVRHMKLTEDNKYLVSAGQDRFIYVWRCNQFNTNNANNKKKKKSSNTNTTTTTSTSAAPDFSLALDDSVISLDIQSVALKISKKEMALLKAIQGKKPKKGKKKKITSTKTVYHICGASKSAVYIWRYDPIEVHEQIQKEGADFRLEPSTKISIARKVKGTSADILDLSYFRHIQFMEGGKRLMVMRGTQMIPIVRAVTFMTRGEGEGDTPSFISKIEVEHVNASGALTGRKLDLSGNVDTALKRKTVDQHMTVLDVADRSIPTPKMFDPSEPDGRDDDDSDSPMDDDQKKNKNKNKKKEKKRKRDDDDDSKSGDEGPSAKRQKKESEPATFQEKLFEIEKKAELAIRDGTARIPDASSLYTILTQSLKSNDQALFERLLGIQNDKAMQEFEGDMIQNTLDKISSEDALLLLKKLAERFRVSPRQSLEILKWLLPLLNSHSASFAQDEASRPHLVAVQQTIDYHVKTMLPAMKLQGRLSLMRKQMEKVDHSEEKEEEERKPKGLYWARSTALYSHDDSRETDRQ